MPTLLSLPLGPLLAGALLLTSFGPSARGAAAGIPAAFDKDVLVYGVVESVERAAGGCEARIAVYDWAGASAGFALGELPWENDRYRLRGDAERCAALRVAMEATGGHVAAPVGFARGRWWLADLPLSAAGCGGLVSGWTPGPAGRVF